VTKISASYVTTVNFQWSHQHFNRIYQFFLDEVTTMVLVSNSVLKHFFLQSNKTINSPSTLNPFSRFPTYGLLSKCKPCPTSKFISITLLKQQTQQINEANVCKKHTNNKTYSFQTPVGCELIL
jgi:hypothetical protein